MNSTLTPAISAKLKARGTNIGVRVAPFTNILKKPHTNATIGTIRTPGILERSADRESTIPKGLASDSSVQAPISITIMPQFMWFFRILPQSAHFPIKRISDPIRKQSFTSKREDRNLVTGLGAIN